MKQYLRKRLLNKIRKQEKRIPYAGLDNAKQVMILFQSDEVQVPKNVLALEKMLNKYNLKHQHLGFVPRKRKKDEEATLGFYHQNELNWLGHPQKEIVQELTQHSYDVVFDLDPQEKSPNVFILPRLSHGISVSSNPKDRIDLVIQGNGVENDQWVKEIEHFLNSIEKK